MRPEVYQWSFPIRRHRGRVSLGSKTADKLTFVGIGQPDRSDTGLMWSEVPSTSPLLYSSVRFSADYSRATVDWGKRNFATVSQLPDKSDHITMIIPTMNLLRGFGTILCILAATLANADE